MIRRYLTLYAYFVRFSLSKAMEFRMDFWFRILMDSLYYAVNLLFYKILYRNTPLLAGWTEPQVMIFASGYLLVDAIYMTVFSNNMWMFPVLINRGDLDYYLVRPVSTLFFVSLRDFAFNSFVNLVIACGIMAWALTSYPDPLSPAQVSLYLLLLFNGTLIYWLCYLIISLTAFWSQSGSGSRAIFYAVAKGMEKPDRIFRGWVRYFYTLLLPFSLIASFPARLLLDRFEWAVLFQLLGTTTAFFALTVWLWRRGLRAYSSASS